MIFIFYIYQVALDTNTFVLADTDKHLHLSEKTLFTQSLKVHTIFFWNVIKLRRKKYIKRSTNVTK